MAFLCPVRIKRNKKKKPLHDDSLPGMVPSMGRITGSASIETLVRVGIEKENGLGPESKMVVLHDFTPCVDDELEVKRGQIVHVLYQENDWVYVISEENHEGFIPHSYCAQFGSQMAGLALNVRKKLPRETGTNFGGGGRATSMNGLPTTAAMTTQQQQQSMTLRSARFAGGAAENNLGINTPEMRGGGMVMSLQQQQHLSHNNNNNNIDPSRSNSLMSETSSSQPDVHPFYKESTGRYIVLYSYQAQDENDLSVDRGQCVTVLNSDDPDWYWVARYDQCEGFVPSGFIYPLDAIHRQQGLNSSQQQQQQQQGPYRGVTTAVATATPPIPSSSSSSHMQQQQHLTPVHLGSSHSSPSAATAVPVLNPLGSAGNSSGPSSYSTGGMNSLAAVVGASSNGLPMSDGGGISPNRNGDGRYQGTEMVMLYDYKAQAPDDLSVRRGDWVYADLSNQTVDGWLWSYAPKSRKYGFIPKAYARPPAMTSL